MKQDKKKKRIQKTVRWFLSGLLLWQVWTHAHWSVALSLTLIFVGFELINFLKD